MPDLILAFTGHRLRLEETQFMKSRDIHWFFRQVFLFLDPEDLVRTFPNNSRFTVFTSQVYVQIVQSSRFLMEEEIRDAFFSVDGVTAFPIAPYSTSERGSVALRQKIAAAIHLYSLLEKMLETNSVVAN